MKLRGFDQGKGKMPTEKYLTEHGSRINIRFSDEEGDAWGNEIMLRGEDGASR